MKKYIHDFTVLINIQREKQNKLFNIYSPWLYLEVILFTLRYNRMLKSNLPRAM